MYSKYKIYFTNFEGGEKLMAYNNRYQYETSPRKLQPDYERIHKKYPKKSTVRKANVNKKAKIQSEKHIKSQVKVMLYVAIRIYNSFCHKL